MYHVKKLLSDNFLFYASYVIRDRAIPHIDDGLKPVQRRILHSLFEMDDGKFHKVSNVVGNTMKYHPHGDSSIFMALVLLSHKGLFIDPQGNFGNILTGDEPAAARYIECRINNFAKETLYSPKITDYVDSYDGRNREPVVFPALLPFLLISGAEGIAVGMSTSIMPHNCREVMQAVRASLMGEPFTLYPDFPTGGKVDISNYEEGMGKVLIRAGVEIVSDKRVVIRELPYGKTTGMLISSIESAVRKGKIHISEINDYTAESVEIELKLGRGESAENIIESLYAFSDCEISLSLNCLLIKGDKPCRMTISEIIHYHAGRLQSLLKRRLQVECNDLMRRLHVISLERIFITKKIYSRIEKAESTGEIFRTIREGFAAYSDMLNDKLSEEDINFLLKIPIRRISRYDIERSRDEEGRLLAELKKKKNYLRNLRNYAAQCVDNIIEKYDKQFPRRSQIEKFTQVHARKVSSRDLEICYDKEKGQLGYRGVSGKTLLAVSEFERLLLIRSDGSYTVIVPPQRMYVGNILYCLIAEKEALANIVFSLIYTDREKRAYIKRCRIMQYQVGREYSLLPPETELQSITMDEKIEIKLKYRRRARQRKREDIFPLTDYRIKGVKAAGVRLSPQAISHALFKRRVNRSAGE